MHTAMTTSEALILALLVILTLPYAVWRLGRTDYYAPLVVVQVVAGILLGPGVLGKAFPEIYAAVFRPDVLAPLNGLALWGVMLFVWVAGIELDLTEAWRRRRETGLTASLALATPLLFGAAAGLLLLHWPGWVGRDGTPVQVVLGLAMACAVTAVPVLLLMMDKLAITRRALGQRLLRYASLDDVAIWAVLGLILVDWERAWRQIAFLVLFAPAAFAVRQLFARVGEGDRWFLGLVWLAACGFAADRAGLHYMVGAFLAGVIIDARGFARDKLDGFRRAVLLALMPVYFLSAGLRTEWGVGGASVFAAAALLLVAAVAGKLAGLHVAGRFLKWGKGEATVLGWLLQTKGLVMIVFAQVLLDKAIITNEAFTALLLMAVASTMLTVPVVKPRLERLPGLGDKVS